MKSLLVVTQLNDTFYIDYDTEFVEYIINRAKIGGLLEEDAETTQLDANLVMQLFSPLVLSQWLLIDQTKEPCSSIQCSDGFLFAFRHTDDLLFIAVNGDGTESEKFLHRKIQVFMTILRFIFGPSCEEMAISNVCSKKEKSALLRQLMQSWSDLVHSEQAFLVEAIERVHVNQMVNEKCMDALLKSVKQFQFAREQPVHHALLLVNSKLLALYSNRSAHELQSKDILMAMILSKTLYPQADKLEDLFSKFYMTTKTDLESTFVADDNSDAGDDEYHSAPNTPGGHRSQSPTSSQKSAAADSVDLTDDDLQVEKSGENMTLLDMFMKKCPDVVLQSAAVKNVIEKEQMATVNSKHGHTVNVEAVVHQPAEVGHSLVEHEVPTNHLSHEQLVTANQKNLSTADLLDVQNEHNSKSISHSGDASAMVKHEIVAVESNQSNIDCLLLPETAVKDSVDPVKVITSRENDSLFSEWESQNKEFENIGTSLIGYGLEPDASPNISLIRKTQSTDNRADGKYVGVSFSSYAGSDVQSSSIGQQHNMTGKSGMLGSKSKEQNSAAAVSKRITPSIGDTRSGSTLPSNKPMATRTATDSSSVTYETASSTSALSGTDGIYLPQTIFLETPTCLYSPYNMHAIQIAPGLMFLVLCQAPRYSLADCLYQVIQTVQDVLCGRRSKLPRSRSIYVYDTIHTQLGKVYNGLKKIKGKVKNLSFDVLVRWEKEDIRHKLLDFLEKDSHVRVPPELESTLVELYKKLRELFSHLFLSPVPYSPQLLDLLTLIRDRLKAELMDYREYLNVKAQRNITMTSYIDDFPGLIHFIFIDRHFHQITAPSMNISLRAEQHMDATSYLKDKIWAMYQLMMSKLTEGYTTVMMRDGDFYFSYFLWFEDQTGNPLPVQESFKPSRRQHYPGILCGPFYKELLQSCFPHAIQGNIRCMEMFLMHLGTVHPMYIAAHSKKLAYKMWDISGEIDNSSNLL